MESLMHLFEYLMTDTYKVFQNCFTFSLSYFFLCVITPYHAPSQNPCSSLQQSLALRILLGIFSFLPDIWNLSKEEPLGVAYQHEKRDKVTEPV